MHRPHSTTFFCAILLALGVVLAPAQTPAPTPPHIVVVISLEGLGPANLQRADAKNLLALGSRGSWAPQGMLPAYPAENFPDQLTIATGLYPGHHGIVAGSFFDPARNARFSSVDPKTTADGSWYVGTPLWSLAENHGIPTACIAWPGCDAQIAGARPKYQSPSTDPAAQLRQILDWLRLPDSRRPRLILAQFPEPAATIRRFGPDAPEARAALRKIDVLIGRLHADLDRTRLPIDLVILSDHGFAKPDGGWIALDQFADLSGFNNSGLLLYAKSDADRERVYNQLKKATSEFFVFRLQNFPAALHMDKDPRLGDPVVYATGAFPLRLHAPAAGAADPLPRALDGFDPHLVPQMKAVFFAAGPDIVEGRTVAPFDSVHLYPWLSHLLGLTPPKNDGSLNILSGTLRDHGEEAADNN